MKQEDYFEIRIEFIIEFFLRSFESFFIILIIFFIMDVNC